MKKGQVSIFLLLGLILVLFVSFFVFYSQLGQEEILVEEVAVSPIQLYVEGCLEAVGDEGIEFVALQGGYYTTLEPYYELGAFDVTYYSYNNEDTIVSFETIEKEIGMFVDDIINYCLDDFSSFVDQGYEFEQSSPSTAVVIGEKSVSFDLSYPITASVGESITSYDTFSATIDSEVYSAYTVAQEIIYAHESDATMPLSDINVIVEAYGVYVDMGHFNSTVLYTIRIPEDDNDVFFFTFGVLYNWGDPIA
jgi:hypothetical protein